MVTRGRISEGRVSHCLMIFDTFLFKLLPVHCVVTAWNLLLTTKCCSLLINWLWRMLPKPPGVWKADAVSVLKRGQSCCHWVEELEKKTLFGSQRTWQGWTEGQVQSRASWIYSACRDGSNFMWHVERHTLKHFHPNSTANKLQPQEGVWLTLLYWTKELSIITGGQEGGQNSKQDTMRFLCLLHRHTHTHTYTAGSESRFRGLFLN